MDETANQTETMVSEIYREADPNGQSTNQQGAMAHACNPTPAILEAGAGGL